MARLPWQVLLECVTRALSIAARHVRAIRSKRSHSASAFAASAHDQMQFCGTGSVHALGRAAHMERSKKRLRGRDWHFCTSIQLKPSDSKWMLAQASLSSTSNAPNAWSKAAAGAHLQALKVLAVLCAINAFNE
jgi:hypothetical protein